MKFVGELDKKITSPKILRKIFFKKYCPLSTDDHRSWTMAILRAQPSNYLLLLPYHSVQEAPYRGVHSTDERHATAMISEKTLHECGSFKW